MGCTTSKQPFRKNPKIRLDKQDTYEQSEFDMVVVKKRQCHTQVKLDFEPQTPQTIRNMLDEYNSEQLSKKH